MLLAGCVDALTLAGRACPCLSGWRCCARAGQCVPDDDPCPGPLALDVERASLPILGEHRFACDEPVAFAVEEPRGGVIDEDGTYHAPFAREVFHVTATSRIDAARTVRVPITVGPTTLEVYTGAPGAPGNADGQGADARMGIVDQLVSDGNGLLYFTQSGNIFFAQAKPSMVRYVSLGGAVGTTTIGGLWLAWKNDQLWVADETTLGDQIGMSGVFVRAGAPGVSAYVEGAAASARFVKITGIAPDGDDGIYLAEEAGAIRRYDLGSMTVSLVAGAHGTRAFADGDTATARFGTLGRIASDGAGGLYIADEGNRRLRHLSAAGMVSTTAMLDGSEPIYGITTLPSGELLLTRGNAILRLVNGALVPWSGERATLDAVDGALGDARYWAPRALAVVGDTLYVADGGNHAVRAIAPLSATPAVTTLAGSMRKHGDNDGPLAEARLRGPSDFASDGARVYVSEHLPNSGGRVRALEAGSVRTHAQGFRVSAMAAASDGTIYFSDDPANQVSSLSAADATPRLFAGSPSKLPGAADGVGEATSFDSPRGLALAPDGSLYLADYGNGRIRRIDTLTRQVETIVRDLNRPHSLALDGNTLFVAASDRLIAIDLPTRAPRTIADPVSGLVSLAGVVVGAPGSFVYLIDDRRVFAMRADGSARLLLAGDSTQLGFLAGPLPSRLNQPHNLWPLSPTELLITDFIENTIGVLR